MIYSHPFCDLCCKVFRIRFFAEISGTACTCFEQQQPIVNPSNCFRKLPSQCPLTWNARFMLLWWRVPGISYKSQYFIKAIVEQIDSIKGNIWFPIIKPIRIVNGKPFGYIKNSKDIIPCQSCRTKNLLYKCPVFRNGSTFHPTRKAFFILIYN